MQVRSKSYHEEMRKRKFAEIFSLIRSEKGINYAEIIQECWVNDKILPPLSILTIPTDDFYALNTAKN